MKMKNLMLGLMMMTSMTAIAGERGGNGGDAVVCRDSNGKIVSAELLDYYEGRSLRGLNYQSEVSNVRDFLNSKMNIIKKSDPQLALTLGPVVNELLEAQEKFTTDNTKRINDVIFTSDELQDIQDSDHLTFPKQCDVEQLAIRLTKSYPEDPSFLIQKEIWEKISNLDKAGLILHEAIYKKFVEQGEENSKNARYFNQVISSMKMVGSDYIAYLNLASSAKLGLVENEKRQILPLTVKAYDQAGHYIAETITYEKDKYVVFNSNGKINKKETIVANPRSLYFQTRSLKNTLSYRVVVDGKIMCESSSSQPVQRDTWEEYVYECGFQVLKGKHEISIELTSTKKVTRFYWLVDDKMPSTSTNMSMWFWGATADTAGVLAGSYYDKKIKKNGSEKMNANIDVK